MASRRTYEGLHGGEDHGSALVYDDDERVNTTKDYKKILEEKRKRTKKRTEKDGKEKDESIGSSPYI